jgi:hypothetical protein
VLLLLRIVPRRARRRPSRSTAIAAAVVALIAAVAVAVGRPLEPIADAPRPLRLAFRASAPRRAATAAIVAFVVVAFLDLAE